MLDVGVQPLRKQIIFYTFGILIKRIKHQYGADDRPMLNVYRADMITSESESEANEKVHSICK